MQLTVKQILCRWLFIAQTENWQHEHQTIWQNSICPNWEDEHFNIHIIKNEYNYFKLKEVKKWTSIFDYKVAWKAVTDVFRLEEINSAMSLE